MYQKTRTLTPLHPLSGALYRYAQLDTGKYLSDGASPVAAEVDHRESISSSSPPASHQRLDSVALGRAVTALLGQARSGAGLSDVNDGGSRGVAGEHGVAGLERSRCDIVVVHGCEALDIELLLPGKFGLGPAEAVSVFIDLVPQVGWFEFGLGQAAGSVSGYVVYTLRNDGYCTSPPFQAPAMRLIGEILPIVLLSR